MRFDAFSLAFHHAPSLAKPARARPRRRACTVTVRDVRGALVRAKTSGQLVRVAIHGTGEWWTTAFRWRARAARAIRALPHGHAAPRMARFNVETCEGMLADASRGLRRARRPLRGVRLEVGFFVAKWPRAHTCRQGAQRRARACSRSASTRIPCAIHGSYSLRESRLGLSAAFEICDCGCARWARHTHHSTAASNACDRQRRRSACLEQVGAPI